MEDLKMLILYSFLFSIIRITSPLDTITTGHIFRDGERLVSARESFELGFFSPGKSTNRYFGIWYKKISSGTITWVANRDAPIPDRSGVFSIARQGNRAFVLLNLNSTNGIVWSYNTSKTAQNPVAVLLESGNLAVKDANDNNPDNYLWQSFDYPCDTLLPGMKLGVNLVTGLDRFLSSWKSTDDPAHGDFTFRIDPRGVPQLVLKKGSLIQFRAGPWNGLHWTGVPQLQPNPIYLFEFVSNENEVFYTYHLSNSSIPCRMVVNPSGAVQRLTWIERTKSWGLFSRFAGVTMDQCDTYALCGAYATCNINTNTPECECLEGFTPKSPEDWNMLYKSGGCVRRTPLDCKNGDGFLMQKAVKLPDTRYSRIDKNISLLKCKKLCFDNCSCTAYANSDVREGGSGCLLWFDNLIDMKELPESGQDLYVRMAASEIANIEKERQSRKKKKREAIIITCVLLATGVLLSGVLVYMRKTEHRSQGQSDHSHEFDNNDRGSKKEEMELRIFDWTTIANATNNFSDENKLGHGGFGPVYKGTLTEGQEIAVKRLSKGSRQGKEEFKNEVLLIAKLQHRNLVKLLGCCTQRDERMLIYEYLPNKSLDYFIFDGTRSKLLDWSKRYHIIGGIARGLLYLHQDSRLRIIHRDLKASNILLDNEMNPKISDFGLARTFGVDQTEANTERVVGTYGYMSPEYAVDGIFSLKSDVFSFGVLILEIVSGKKNRGFSHADHDHNLLGHAWRLWIEERAVEIIDISLDYSCALSEALRCIQVGLLCVQQRSEDRPNMSSVLLMLNGERSLPQPKQPGFFTERNPSEMKSYESYPSNEITFSSFEAR